MSDSEWEVLSSDGEGQSLSQIPPSPLSFSTASHTARATATAAADDSARRSASSHLPPSRDRRSILTPLCLTLNQTGTRLGVGHTKGFLVFRVSPTPPATTTAAAAAAAAAPIGAAQEAVASRSHLVLDPQYNVDLYTFSRVRERLRRTRQAAAAAAAAINTTAAAATPAGVPTLPPSLRDQESRTTRWEAGREGEGVRGGVTTRAAVPQGAIEKEAEAEAEEEQQEEPQGPELDVDDLGSFLNAAGRAFAQLKRDDAHHGDSPSVTASRKRDTRVNTTESAAAVFRNAEEKEGKEEETGEAKTVPAAADAAAAALTALDVAPLPSPPPGSQLLFYPPRQETETLEWGTEEDIDVDGPESSGHYLPLGSIGDSVAARRTKGDVQHPRAHDSTTHQPNSDRADDVQSDEEEEEDSYVGFGGGGVAVMSLLYDQTWLALVGGGTTPMGPPNHVQLVRDGEVQHRLALPHPVVRLFLDARLLFVVTTAELRVYSNPLEHNWVCLRQTVAMYDSLAARYAAVTLAPLGSSGEDHAAASVWGASAKREAARPVEVKNDSDTTFFHATASETQSAVAAPPVPSAGMALPSIPVVVDYARSLLLLPSGDLGTGFTLYRYVTGPEPVARHIDARSGDTTSASFATSRRTTAYLEVIAAQTAAHQNPLHNLVLYVGWPAASTRLLPTGLETSSSRNAVEDHPSTSASQPPPAQSHARVSSRSSFGRDGGRSSAVTLVAASSEYATRITLWMLATDDDSAVPRSQQSSNPGGALRDPLLQSLSSTTSSTGAANSAEARFVLLREFRVGLRLRPPRVLLATLPGVSRLMTRAPQPSGASGLHAGAAGGGGSGGVTPHPSAASLAQEGRRRDEQDGGYALPVDPASSSAISSYRGTVASWAGEAASVVAAAGSAATPGVHHLQFAGNGAYLLCVHGADTISVFSTSAPESEREARDVTRDRAAAAQNRYSRLAVMKEYLPKTLSNRLDAYTRQAWSSCAGHLPSYDMNFVPRWLFLKQQDAAAAAAAAAAVAKPRSAVDAAGSSAHTAASPAPRASATPLPSTSSVAEAPVGGRRFFERLSALVGARSPPNHQQQLSEPPQRQSSVAGSPLSNLNPTVAAPSSSVSDAQQQHAQHCSSQTESDSTSGGRSPAAATGTTTENAAVVRWGSPLSELPRCIVIWSGPAHTSHSPDVCGGGSSTGRGAARASAAAARCPLVLNCATCEGAFANVFLYAEEGEIVSSNVVPYTTE